MSSIILERSDDVIFVGKVLLQKKPQPLDSEKTGQWRIAQHHRPWRIFEPNRPAYLGWAFARQFSKAEIFEKTGIVPLCDIQTS